MTRPTLPMLTTDRPLTPELLASRWGCTAAHIRQMCRSGRLRHFRIGASYRIPLLVVEQIEACGAAKSSDRAPNIRAV